MSAGAIDDAGNSLLSGGAERPVSTELEIAAGGKAQPKVRTKRPRPTFDDGSVTRVFKFPSKAYPRSSYYVTSTEIIIQIKKARKKWKLVVPKKRVAAYRTNRWFAKPRWVEIELTYTQASKFGLVEPRTPSTEVTSGLSAVQQVARHPIASDLDFLSDDDHLDDNTVLPRSPAHDNSLAPVPQASPDADAFSSQATSAVAAARPRTDRAPPRAGAFLLIASSALGLLSAAAAWITLSGSSTTPMTVDLACTRSEQSLPCPQAIVTGAIGKVDQPQSAEPRPSAAFETHASSELISAIEQLQVSAPEIPKTATIPTEREDDSAKLGNRVNEPTTAVNAAAESEPLPATTIPKTSLLLPKNASADRNDCRELRAASRSINIQFDYASSRLNQALLPALESFAVRLRSCPSAKVIVEGHSNSDGRAAWNQSLSLHRAQAVLKHLVYAGVQPSQLSAIGFGQSRPYAPNVSTKNKRSNRRAALVVDVRR